MPRNSIILLLSLIAFARAAAQDPELTNYKSGIDVVWGTGDGSDKGTAYQEEYWFHDKLINDTKTVFLRSTTQIAMSHNARNMVNRASSTNDRQHVIYTTGDAGQIRYEVDRLWDESRFWGPPSSSRKPAYTAPFTLGGISYEAGVPVVGTTGARPGYTPGQGGFYWRGMIDSAGDEWHVLMYADDDDLRGGGRDASANDGKYVLLVVNPKTPAATWRSSGSGQFYTTPAWTYWVPKIHDQTTYIQGTVTCELRNIYGGAIAYRISSGGVSGSVQGGTLSTYTLTEAAFADGVNLLEYWYTATPSVVRTRTVVKNPGFPSAGEVHGVRLWGGPSAWTTYQARAARAPYSAAIADAQTDSGAGHTLWESRRRQGWRFGGSNWAIKMGSAATNAHMARYLGFTASRAGATRTYAQYAKEMLMETPLNQHPVGMEVSWWASHSIPAADIYYRGYWDWGFANAAVTAYHMLIDGYRSDQVSGGITPVEDYFIRDRLADYVHQQTLQLGGFAEPQIGMWAVSRHVAAMLATIAMTDYSTSYFGTSGMNGSSTVYQWAPFSTYNHTWRSLFLDHNYTLRPFTQGPSMLFGIEGSVVSGALTRDPGNTVYQPVGAFIGNHVATFVDRVSYASFNQMGGVFSTYAIMRAIHAPQHQLGPLNRYINEVTAGTLWGAKDDDTDNRPDRVRFGPTRVHMAYLLNPYFPQAAANMTAYAQSVPSSDANSEEKIISGGGLGALFFYDDTYYGSGGADISSPSVSILSPTSSPSMSTSTTPLVISGTATDNIGVSQVTWTNSGGGSGTASGTGTWSFSVNLSTGSNVVTVRAFDASGNSSTDTLTITYSVPTAGVPDAPTNLSATAVSPTQIDLTWADNDDTPDETSFRIERSTTSGSGFSEIGTVAANVTSYSDAGLTASTTYYYRVRARNDDGDSAYTPEASATTQGGGSGSAGMTVVTAHADELIVTP